MEYRRLICILSVLVCISASARQYRFEAYTQEDGLPGNSVTVITQDLYGFIWIGTRDGLCRSDGEKFIHINGRGNVFLDRPSVSMLSDSQGKVWISCAESLGYIDTRTDEIRTILKNPQAPSFSLMEDRDNNIWMVCGDAPQKISRSMEVTSYSGENGISAYRCCSTPSGDIWFSSSDGNIYRYVSETDSFIGTPVLSENDVRGGLQLRYIAYVSSGRLLVSTNRNDLLLVNPSRGNVEKLFSGDEDKREAIIIDIAEGPESDYWMSTDRGLYVFSQDGSYRIYHNNPSDPTSLSSDNVRHIFKDRDGHMWIATFYSGLNVWRPSEIESYAPFPDSDDHSIAGHTIRTIYMDSDSGMWIGTEDGHMNFMDTDGRISELGPESGLPRDGNYHSVIEYEGDIFIATYNSGIDIMDKKTRKVRRHIDIDEAHPVTLFKTKSDVLLIGSNKGLYRYDPETQSAECQDELGDFFIHAITQDHLGNIWVGTYGKGIFLWDLDAHRVSRIRTVDNTNISSMYITSLFEDEMGTMWATTEGNGLLWISADDGKKRDFGFITTADGLGSDVTCAMASDTKGNIWASTSKGIFCIDPVSKTITDRLYDKRKGAGASNYFRYGSVCKSPSGVIYMGSTCGMMAFSPEHISEFKAPEILFTDIMATGKEGMFHVRENGKSAMETSKISLKKKDATSIYIIFSSMGGSVFRPFSYDCKLIRNNKVFHESNTTNGSMSFIGLQPGHYLFTVSLAGLNEQSEPSVLKIVIHPPFQRSMVAYILYALAAMALSYAAYRSQTRKRNRAAALSVERLEAEKRKEIYDAKINFFTNLTHEIRTPLTLIKMPLEKIIENKEYAPQAKQDLLTIKANTDRLLDLSNQLLDLRKIEAKEMKLNFMMEDICSITREVCDCFASVTEERHIAFESDIPDKPVMAMCAGTSVKKILMNLVSNAVKYCRTSVSVSLCDMGDDWVTVRVHSDGTPIMGSDRDRIFDNFYQGANAASSNITGSSGTGLGLPFAKTLAELHGGSIVLEDETEDGNTFTFHLPKTHDDAISLKCSIENEETEEDDLMEGTIARMHSILVVEDDLPLNDYIRKELSSEYRVHQAKNGEEAIQMLKDVKIDLVISDIMMPVVDGCQLCNFIKSNLEYSHIPVILMTAVVGMDTRIETLNIGADAYIEKPFSMPLLKANIANLFMNREITFKQFTGSPLSHFNGLKVNNMDDEYMNNLHSAVMEHMADPDFTVEKLIQILGTSKSTMFRKVKANTGMNINEFIRVCRLKKAAELLATRAYRINEVSYMVGYSSSSYFASMFQKQFNISPSDFLKNARKEDSQ